MSDNAVENAQDQKHAEADYESHNIDKDTILAVEKAIWDLHESWGYIQPPFAVQDTIQALLRQSYGENLPKTLNKIRTDTITHCIERNMPFGVLMYKRLPSDKRMKVKAMMEKEGYIKNGRFYRKGAPTPNHSEVLYSA